MISSTRTLDMTQRKRMMEHTMNQITNAISTKDFIIDETTTDGDTPLMFIMGGYADISKYTGDEDILSFYEKSISNLIYSGLSNPQHVSNNGSTALINACCYGELFEQFAMALIETGKSNPSQANYLGHTALMCACNNELEDVALALIDTGKSNPGQLDENTSNTALILACLKNLPEVALEIIETGESKPFHRNKNGRTALDFAMRNQDDMEDVIVLLKEMKYTYDLLGEDDILPMSQVQIDLNQEGFNAIQQERNLIKNHITENSDNLVFMVNNNFYLTNKREIQTQFYDDNHSKYGCYNAGNNQYNQDGDIIGMDFTADENINYENKFFSMSSIFGMQILVRSAQILKVIAKSNKTQLYVIQPTKTTLPAIISKAYIDGASGVSADHCQTGKKTQVYSIKRAVASIVFSSLQQPNSVSVTENAVTTEPKIIKILYKGVSYPIEITETTKIGELKTLFLNALISKEDTLVKSLNFHVKFIYAGKIHMEDDKPLSDLANPPFGMTLQAMVSPKTGGKNKNKNKKTHKKLHKKSHKKNTKIMKSTKRAKRIKTSKTTKRFMAHPN